MRVYCMVFFPLRNPFCWLCWCVVCVLCFVFRVSLFLSLCVSHTLSQLSSVKDPIFDHRSGVSPVHRRCRLAQTGPRPAIGQVACQMILSTLLGTLTNAPCLTPIHSTKPSHAREDKKGR